VLGQLVEGELGGLGRRHLVGAPQQVVEALLVPRLGELVVG
jgi:hypothetical protein